MDYAERIEKIGMPGEMGIARFFVGTSYEVKVMRLSPKDRYCLHIPDVPWPVYCDTTLEVMRNISAWLSRFSKRKECVSLAN